MKSPLIEPYTPAPRTGIKWPRLIFATLVVYAAVGVPGWLVWCYMTAADDAVTRYDVQVYEDRR